ncbi:MAG: hypothetical protein KDB54_05550, partial [Solirubrobacterales bacterium]|nr:hypothetical protein [Solirubrobacterales bacterium]
PDIGQVRRGLNESLAELLAAAEEVENSIAPSKKGKPGKKAAGKGASSNGAAPKGGAGKSTSRS